MVDLFRSIGNRADGENVSAASVVREVVVSQAMSKIKVVSVALATVLTMAQLGAEGFAAGSTPADKASAAAAMTTEELYRLYQGRSWIWKDGAGYFRNSKREFTAFSGQNGSSNYGQGRWFLTSRGRVCFRADWVSAKDASEALTCFEHRSDGRRIYQRRAPDGDWYVFKHSPMRASDEARKLKPGDYVSKGLARAKRTLAN